MLCLLKRLTRAKCASMAIVHILSFLNFGDFSGFVPSNSFFRRSTKRLTWWLILRFPALFPPALTSHRQFCQPASSQHCHGKVFREKASQHWTVMRRQWPVSSVNVCMYARVYVCTWLSMRLCCLNVFTCACKASRTLRDFNFDVESCVGSRSDPCWFFPVWNYFQRLALGSEQAL